MDVKNKDKETNVLIYDQWFRYTEDTADISVTMGAKNSDNISKTGCVTVKLNVAGPLTRLNKGHQD